MTLTGSQATGSFITVVKRWPGDNRRERREGAEHFEVETWESFLKVRRIVEERKLTLSGHIVVEILDPHLHSWFADIERIGSPVVTVISDSPSEELRSILRTFGFQGGLDGALSDELLLELGVLADPPNLQALARLYWARLRAGDKDAVSDLIFAASTGLHAFDEPNLGKPESLVDELLKELIELRISNLLGRLETSVVRDYLSRILRIKIAKALKNSQRSEELMISSFQKNLEHRDLSAWVDSLLVSGVLRPNPLVPRLMIQMISREMGIDYLDDVEIVARIGRLLARDNPRRRPLVIAMLRWDRIAEMNTHFREHLVDLTVLEPLHPDPFALAKVVESSTGILVAELTFILEKTVDLWKTDPRNPPPEEWMTRIKERFLDLLEIDRESRELAEILGVFGNLASRQKRIDDAKPSDLPGWSVWYKDLLLLEDGLARLLQRIEDVRTGPRFLECAEWLDRKLHELVQSRTEVYVRWLTESYPSALRSPASPILCNCIMRIREQMSRGGRVVLLVIDSLRMDFWFLIQELFAESGVEVESYEPVLSMLPSYTNVSRRSFFGGMSFPSMTELCASRRPRVDPQDEPKVLAMQLGIDPTNVKFVEAAGKTASAAQGAFIYVNDPSAYEWALRAGYPLTVLVYVMLDMFTHPQQHGVHVHKDMMRAAFAEISKRLARHLANDPAMRLFIATDHGFTSTDIGTKIEVPAEIRAGSGVVEIHPRFVVVGRLPENSPAKLKDRSLHVFGKDTPVTSSGLGLPAVWTFADRGQELYVDYWIFPRGADTFFSTREFAHGGLSFYETLIPFAVLKSRDVKPIRTIRVSADKRVLENHKEELITLVLANTGNVRLRGLHVQVRFEGDRTRDLTSGEQLEVGGEVRYPILHTPSKEGRMTATIRYSSDAMGEVLAGEVSLDFSVVPNSEEERRRKLSLHRPADDLFR